LSTSSSIKGVIENSSNFHMDYVRLKFNIPKRLSDKIAIYAKKHEAEIAGLVEATIVIATTVMTGGASGAIIAMARVVAQGVSKKAIKTMAKKTIKNGVKKAKNVFKRKGKNKSAFKKKNPLDKISSLGMFMAAAPFKIVAAILGALFKMLFLFLIILWLIINIYKFLIQFVGRIAFPLALGSLYLVFHSLLFPIFYLIKDIIFNNFGGTFKELTDEYIAGITNILKVLFKTYIYYIIIVMAFITVYKISIGIFIYVSTHLMFVWETFNLPVAIATLAAFSLATQLMAKIIDLILPESQIAKFNLKIIK
jgi:hypothetical protein